MGGRLFGGVSELAKHSMKFSAYFIISLTVLLNRVFAQSADDSAPQIGFVYNLPDGSQFTPESSPADLGNFAAALAIQHGEYVNAYNGVLSVNAINQRYVAPVETSLQNTEAAEKNMDAVKAQADVNQINSEMKALNDSRLMGLSQTIFHKTGINPEVAKFWNSFQHFMNALTKSVNDAQDAPQRITTALTTDNPIPGLALLDSAQTLDGRTYETGMQCNDLIEKAAKLSYMTIVTTRDNPNQPASNAWFHNGMGPQFQQIFGDSDGKTLQQFIDYAASPDNKIPLGSVIVAQGHAALYSGLAMMRGKQEIILYDANEDQRGWVLSIDGTPCPIDGNAITNCGAGGPLLRFPPNQVGQHLTWLQWRDARLIKVYRPIGNNGRGNAAVFY